MTIAEKMYNKSLHWIFTPLRSVKTSELAFSATLRVAENRGADFVKYLVPPRFARQNKVLDRTP